MNKIVSILIISILSLGSSFAQDPLLKKIPSSSLFVASLETKNLLSKLNMDAIRNLEMIQDTKKSIKKLAKKDSSLVEQLFTDPSVHGLYFQPSSYVYLDYESNKNTIPSVGMLIPLKNGKKLQKMIISVIGKEEFYKNFEKKKGYMWTEDKEFAIAYTKSYLLLYKFESKNSALTLDEKIEALLNGNLASILSNDQFVRFQKKQTDLYYWMSLGSLFESAINAASEEDKEILSFFDNFKDLQFGYRINFNNGVLNYQSEAYLTSELTKKMAKVYGNGIPQEMLKLVPQKDLYAIAGMSFNMIESEKLAQEALKEFGELVEEKISEEVVKNEVNNDPFYVEKYDEIESDTTLSYFDKFEEYDKLDNEKDSLVNTKKEEGMAKLDSTLSEYGVKRAELWSLFNGNMLAAINGTMAIIDTFETYDYVENEDGDFGYYQVEKTRNLEIPLFKFILDTKNPQLIQIALDSITSKGFLNKEEGNYYSFSLTQYDYFVALTKTNIILSNDKEFITEKLKGYNEKDQIKGTHVSTLANNPAYFYLDLQKTIEASKKSLEDEKQAIMVLEELEKTFESITSTSTVDGDVSSGDININFMDKNANALFSILRMSNNLYLAFTRNR